MQMMGFMPAARILAAFLFTFSSVSPKYWRCSEWPMMTYSTPSSFTMSTLTLPV